MKKILVLFSGDGLFDSPEEQENFLEKLKKVFGDRMKLPEDPKVDKKGNKSP